MKLYRVKAKECGWDQYDEFLIWAHWPEQALKIAQETAEDGFHENNFKDATVTEEIPPAVAGIALGSFNAG